MIFKLILIVLTVHLCEAELNFFDEIKIALKLYRFDTETFRTAYDNVSEIANTIRIECYNPKTNRKSNITGLHDRDIPTKIDLTQKVGFLFHGWRDSFDCQWMIDVYSSWIENRPENICRVDWSYLAQANYLNASRTSITIVANYMVELLNEFNAQHNVKYSDMILVGHSLGAHISGIIGYEVNEPIGLIIGLDPSGPFFTVPSVIPHRYRLDYRDAIIVQAIHTSDGTVGSTIDIGRQDIRINTGFIPQRGCTYPNLVKAYHNDVIQCSHLRSVQFFQSSLINKNKCRAVRCENLLQYYLKTCSKVYDVMGLDTKGIPGTFYIASLDEPECINQQYRS